jgi:hypothetical protein
MAIAKKLFELHSHLEAMVFRPCTCLTVANDAICPNLAVGKSEDKIMAGAIFQRAVGHE